jgi:hypothetical protein
MPHPLAISNQYIPSPSHIQPICPIPWPYPTNMPHPLAISTNIQPISHLCPICVPSLFRQCPIDVPVYIQSTSHMYPIYVPVYRASPSTFTSHSTSHSTAPSMRPHVRSLLVCAVYENIRDDAKIEPRAAGSADSIHS